MQVRPDAVWWHHQGRETQRHVFVTALILRMAFVLITVAFASQLGDLSRDSIKYDMRGRDIAEAYMRGTNSWSLWIDHGWFQFVGLVYFLTGPFLITVQLINVLVASVSAAILCRVAFIVTQNRAATIVSGYTLAVFPSIVWYTSLPLKDAVGSFALISICLGTLLIVVTKNRSGWLWIIGGMILLLSLRVYLVPICGGCVALCLLPIRFPGGFTGVVKWAGASALFLGGLFLAVRAAGIDVLTNQTFFQYMDIDSLNNVRDGMNSGNARLFEHDYESHFGRGIFNDIYLFLKGVFFFVFSIDLSNITRMRQLAAVPELLFFLICLPYLFVGIVKGLNRNPERVLPLVLFGLALVIVYGTAATNMGAMYRWRMQAVPFLIVLICYGAILMRRGPLYKLLARHEFRNATR